MAVFRFRLLAFGCLLSVALANDDGTCTVGADGQPSCGAGESHRRAAASKKPAAPVSAPAAPGPQASLIAQEIDELKGIIELSQERVKLLGDLQAALDTGYNLSIPASHAKALRDKVPLFTDYIPDSYRTPTAAAEDYLLTKAVIPFSEEISFVKFLPLRSPRSSTASGSGGGTIMPTALLVAAKADGSVMLFTPAGELVLSFSAGHEHPVTHLAVSPSHEEYAMATADVGGIIRVHKITVKPRKVAKENMKAKRNPSEEKVSAHLGSAVNVTALLNRQMQVPQEGDRDAAKVTALALAATGGTKYLLVGDASGMVTVFTRNGTVHSRIDASVAQGAGVDSLSANTASVLFRTGADWGYLDLEKMKARHIDCPMFEGQAQQAILDSQQSSRVLVSDQEGTLWTMSVRNKKECRVELKFAPGATRGPLELGSVRGFVLGVERPVGQPSAIVALNMSQVAKNRVASGKASAKQLEELEVIPPPPENAVVWRKVRPPFRDWTLHRRGKEGDLLAFLSEDGHEIEVLELLMQVYTAPTTDQFGNFKMPVIAVAVILVLGYQYMKQKKGGGFGAGAGKGKFGGDDFGADFASQLRNKKTLAGLRGK